MKYGSFSYQLRTLNSHTIPRPLLYRNWLVFACSFLLTVPITSIADASGGFEKCQNEHGQWRYAKRADQACESRITSLNQQGAVLGNRDLYTKPAPEETPDAKRLADKLILLRFSSLEAIENERSRKISEITQQKTVLERLIKDLRTDMAFILNQPEKEQNQIALDGRIKATKRYQEQVAELDVKLDVLQKNYDQLAEQYSNALNHL